MREDLEARAEKLAAEAQCVRCGTVIREDPSGVGVALVTLRALATDMFSAVSVCGMCSLVVRECLMPELLDDAKYLTLKANLIGMWYQ